MLKVGRVFSIHWIDWLRTMDEQPSKLSCFVAELRRRHVFRVAVGYAAVAFVVLQLGEIVLPAFSAEWALQFVVVFAVLGFPVVMVLAWVFDITSTGIQVTAALDDDGAQLPDAPGIGVLPRLALLSVTLLAVGGVGSWWILNTVEGTGAGTNPLGPPVVAAAYDPNEPIRSMAVLPLQNFSEDAGQDYFAAGMHEALLERLSQLPEVRVVSRTSVAQYANTAKTIPEIARELGVEGIVEGSVFRADDEVRITVQLIHGASDTHIWAQSYQRSLSDVLALQSEVADAIAEEIRGRLSAGSVTSFTSPIARLRQRLSSSGRIAAGCAFTEKCRRSTARWTTKPFKSGCADGSTFSRSCNAQPGAPAVPPTSPQVLTSSRRCRERCCAST